MWKTVCAGLAIVLVTAAPALAQGFDGWRDRGTFGAWTVICNELDDMGGITVNACAARGDGGLVFGLNDGQVYFALPGAVATDALQIGDMEFAMWGCPAGRCPTLLDEASLFLDIQTISLIRGDAIATIELAGLSDALAEGVRLVD